MSERDDMLAAIGGADIYLLDQVIKGRLAPPMRVLDAGSGGGRNLDFLARMGLEVWAVDRDAGAIEALRRAAAGMSAEERETRLRAEPIEAMTFEDAAFDAVVANAVLHFARGPGHFTAMIDRLWRVLKPGGIFFARLCSSIGIEDRVAPLGEGRYRLPDGSDRFLVDEAMLIGAGERLGARQIEPIKTVNVQGARCMTNWCLVKP